MFDFLALLFSCIDHALVGLSHTGIVLLPRMSKDRVSLSVFDNSLFYLIYLIVDHIVNVFDYG